MEGGRAELSQETSDANKNPDQQHVPNELFVVSLRTVGSRGHRYEALQSVCGGRVRGGCCGRKSILVPGSERHVLTQLAENIRSFPERKSGIRVLQDHSRRVC